MSLPRSAQLSLWISATLRGLVGPDDFAEAVRGDDPQHLVLGWPGRSEPLPLVSLPAAVARADLDRVSVALPAPGDPTGLGGPAEFNSTALQAGEAVIVSAEGAGPAYGLIPEYDARTVLWRTIVAHPAPVLDRHECAGLLRQSLVTTTAALVALDVAAWQPEIPDLLLNLRHREDLPLPPGTDPRTVETLERAVICLEIVELALRDDGGAVSAAEMSRRRACLTELDSAARRAVVAFCSDNLRAP